MKPEVVDNEFELTAASMKEKINKFVQASGNSKMVALVVSAHGNSDGDILGVDNKPNKS